MKPYTLFKHDGSTVPPSFDLAEFEDDKEARAHALQLLAEHPRYSAIEVWDGLGEPFTVVRLSSELDRPQTERTRGAG